MASLQPFFEHLHSLFPAGQFQAILEPILSRLPHDWHLPILSSAPTSVKLGPGSILAALLVWPILRRFVLSNPLDKVPGPEGGPLVVGEFIYVSSLCAGS